MSTYIALLRGVNVGGNTLKMERIREIWNDLGFKNVRTYVQSGNVVFEAKGPPSTWSPKIEQALAGEARLAVTVVIRTAAELAQVIIGNPFLKQQEIDCTKLHVTFLGGPKLSSTATKAATEQLVAIHSGADVFQIVGNEVYLHCPNGYGTTKLSNNRIEKVLSQKTTTRNWNTVNKLHAMVLDS
jgi:uncharacterized protein (DUF1697 family)